ncbi:hypothetical protein HRbin33_02414 [bacterium HR33]|nr:hypothetical protein HRbin33_02414 [bacterium HR33]
MSREQLRLLGLARRAGAVVVGTEAVRRSLRRGELGVVVLAGDCSRRVEEKVGRLARYRGVPTIVGPEAAELGRILGKGPVGSAGVKRGELARGILQSRSLDFSSTSVEER